MMIYRLISILLILGGGYLIKLSYDAYAKWQEYLQLGDFSGAELYELEFMLTAGPGFPAFFLGSALLGSSFPRRRKRH